MFLAMRAASAIADGAAHAASTQLAERTGGPLALAKQRESAEATAAKEGASLLELGADRFNWADATNWGSTETVGDDWYGVELDARTGRVTRLNLSSNRLAGDLARADSFLAGARLRVLDLRCNALTGSIPESIGGVVTLVELYLSLNKLDGAIPDSLANLAHLEMLALNGNRLEGRVPLGIEKLQRLSYIDLSLNRLQVPAGVSLECASASKIRALILSLREAYPTPEPQVSKRSNSDAAAMR